MQRSQRVFVMFLKGNETTIELLNATSAVRKFASYWLLSVILMFVMAFGLAATQSTQLLHGDRTELMVLGGFVAGFAVHVTLLCIFPARILYLFPAHPRVLC